MEISLQLKSRSSTVAKWQNTSFSPAKENKTDWQKHFKQPLYKTFFHQSTEILHRQSQKRKSNWTLPEVYTT